MDRNTGRHVAIVGAGLSGLLLARELAREGPADLRIDLFDSHFQRRPARTWCLWGHLPDSLRPFVERTWNQMRVIGDEDVRGPLGSAPYHMIRASTFASGVLDELARDPRVRFIRATVTRVEDAPLGALVRTSQGTFTASWAAQSAFAPRGHPILLQHFGGWEVESPRPVFDPMCPTLMDFDLEAESSGVAFHYVLPLTPYRALVEYTVLSSRPWPRSAYDAAVSRYLKRCGAERHRVIRREYGVIPMDPQPLPQRQGLHVFNIGRAGGRTKASTGYTFRRTLRQVEHLIHTWKTTGAPSPVPGGPRRHRFYDCVLLKLLRRRPELGAHVFSRLFARVPFEMVFRFLDEDTHLHEELPILAALPTAPFVGAVFDSESTSATPLRVPA